MFGPLLDKLFNRPVTEEGFAQRFIKAARDAGFSGPLDYRPSEFRLLHDNGAYFNLHNAFRDYQSADKAHKPSVLNGYVSTLINAKQTAPQTFERVRPLLRPVIRNLAMLEEVRLHQARTLGWDAPYSTVYQPLGRDCVTLLAVDYPESTSTLTKGPQEDWGLTMDEALAIAVDNLREATPDAFEEIEPGVYTGRWNDGYDTSRVLLPDVLQRAPIKGLPVFMIPTRDVLLVTGDRDEQGIRNMVEVCFKAIESGRVVSSQVYTYQDQQVVPFISGDAVVETRLASLEQLLLLGAYHDQKELLDTIHAEQQNDVFVATYQLFELAEGNGEAFSVCSWTKTVDTLLPKTDRVALVEIQDDGSANVHVVEWDELKSKLGELLTPVSVYPPLYRTVGFPAEQQLSQLTVLS